MMAATSRQGVRADWFRAFEPLASKGELRCDMDPSDPGHGDGWGVVSYFRPDFPEYLGREPLALYKDPGPFRRIAEVLEREKANLALLHLRKTSVGAVSISNTHPFLHGPWAFCHNGTIDPCEKIPLKRLSPRGSTDSERYFLYIVEKLEESGAGRGDSKRVGEILKTAVADLKKIFAYRDGSETSSFTFLLTDGKTVYAYRDCDPKFQEYYTLYSADLGGDALVCSEPLPEIAADWTPLSNPQLLILS
jgi:glutamine amidotransferase